MDMHYRLIATLSMMLICGSAYAQAIGTTDTNYYEENAKTETWTVKTKTFTAYKSTSTNSWRFVHDGTNLLVVPFLSRGETWSRGQIMQCGCLDLAKKTIIEKKLKVTAEQQAQIDALVEPKEAVKEVVPK